MSSRTRHVAIVGGGVSGLVTAYTALRDAGDALRCTVLEASSRAGGNLVTERHGEFLIDGGPDSWVAAKPDASELCRELGLGGDLIETIPSNRRVYVAHRGALVPLPEGVVLGVPTRFGPIVRSPLLSWGAKLRVARDLARWRPAVTSEDDLSLGELVSASLGREAVSALTEPLLAGIYAGDAWALSARSTFPQLVEMSRRTPSLVRGARAAAPKRHPGEAPPSAFHALKGGVGELIDALVAKLPPETLRLNCGVSAVTPHEGRYRLALTDGSELVADEVVFALPSHVASRLVGEVSRELSDALGAIGWSSAATVFFAYNRRDIARALDATGFVVPKREGMRILASTWVSSKWPGRAPDDKVLLRAFVGGAGHEGMMSWPDDELIALARTDVERLMHFRAEPLFTRVFRFVATSPQPSTGHAARVARVRDALRPHPGIHAIGSAYEGVGIPDVVRLAKKTGAALRQRA